MVYGTTDLRVLCGGKTVADDNSMITTYLSEKKKTKKL